MVMSGQIPFYIIIECGAYPVHSVAFCKPDEIVPTFKHLIYRFLCLTDKGKRAYFRGAQDAKMAASYNGWKYQGKV